MLAITPIMLIMAPATSILTLPPILALLVLVPSPIIINLISNRVVIEDNSTNTSISSIISSINGTIEDAKDPILPLVPSTLIVLAPILPLFYLVLH